MTLEATIADVVKSVLIAELQPLINQQKSNRILPEAVSIRKRILTFFLYIMLVFLWSQYNQCPIHWRKNSL